MGKVPKGAIKGPDNRFLKNQDGSYMIKGQAAAAPVDLAPNAPAPAPALDVGAFLKALAGMSTEERAAIAAVISPPPAAAPAPAAGPRLPPGANPFEYLPLDGALKEALFEMGALQRVELGLAGQRISAVRSSKLAAYIVSRGFPKSRGRTYEGDEHEHEVCTNLKQIVEQNKRLGMSAPLLGWFNFVGGQAAGSPDNWEWLVPQPAIAEAAAMGRMIAPPPVAAAPVETPTRPVKNDSGAYAEDILPGKRTAAQIMESLPKLETQSVDHAA